MEKDKFTPYPASMVPFYGMLAGFEWVSDFCKLEAHREELKDLKKKKRELDSLPVSKADYLVRLRGLFEDHCKHRKAVLLNVFTNNRLSGANPFKDLPSTNCSSSIPQFITWEEVETCVKQMDDIGLSDKDRAVSLGKIDTRKAALEAEIIRLCPKEFLVFKNRNIKSDAREDFVIHWRGLQSEVCEPCCPRGFDLNNSNELEKEAWAKLIKLWMDPKRGHYYPDPG